MKPWNKVFLILFIVLLAHVKAQSLSNQPDYKFWTNAGPGSVIKISPPQDKVLVGHKNGILQLYTIKGQLLQTLKDHSSEIIKIQWLANCPPTTLDLSGTVITWGIGSKMFKSVTWNLLLPTPIFDITTTGINNIFYIAFNLGTVIKQYHINSLKLEKQYHPIDGQIFRKIQYSQNYAYLFASTSLGNVKTYSCVSGQLESFSSTGTTIKAFSLKQDAGYVALNQNNFLYECTAFSGCFYLNSVMSSSVLTYCPTYQFIVTGQSPLQLINYYDNFGVYQSTLTYMKSYVTSLDCNIKYLAAVDESGYVAITSTGSSRESPKQTIVIITSLASAVIVQLIIFLAVKKRRALNLLKIRLRAAIKHKFDDSILSSEPFLDSDINNENSDSIQSNPTNITSPPSYQPTSNPQCQTPISQQLQPIIQPLINPIQTYIPEQKANIFRNNY